MGLNVYEEILESVVFRADGPKALGGGGFTDWRAGANISTPKQETSNAMVKRVLRQRRVFSGLRDECPDDE